MSRRSALIAYAVITLLPLAAYGLPAPLTWGFHPLAFLPLWFTAFHLAAAAALPILIFRLPAPAILQPKPARGADPGRFLLPGMLALVVILGLAFRVEAPLLGDGQFLVRNFARVLDGTEALYIRNEPLATWYYAGVARAIGVQSYPEFLDAFFIADAVAGVVFIVAAHLTIGLLSETRENRQGRDDRKGRGERRDRDERFRLTACGALFSLSALNLFFGYVEVYPVLMAAAALFLLVLVHALRGTLPLWTLGLALIGAILTHYIMLLMLPSVAYAYYRWWRRAGAGAKLAALGAPSLVALLILQGIDFDPTAYISQVPHSHILPIAAPAGGSDDPEVYSSAYTMFSWQHAVDIANAAFLIAPAAIWLALTGFSVLRPPAAGTNRPARSGAIAILAGLVPVAGFFLAAKFDLGTARDWDLMAPFAWPALLAGLLLHQARGAIGRTTLLILSGCALNSLAWFSLNGSAAASVPRFETLLEGPLVSSSARYGGALGLASYLRETKSGSPVATWEEYILDRPDDPRGYRNVLINLAPTLAANDSIIAEAGRRYELWAAARPANRTAAAEYVRFLVGAGASRLSAGKPGDAERLLVRALVLDPESAEAHYQLGRALLALGERTRALEALGEAVKRGHRGAAALRSAEERRT